MTRPTERYGLIARLLVGMMLGSSSNGTANPPAVPVNDAAREISIARDSS